MCGDEEREAMRVIGMISGTSFDAIEAAAAELEMSGDGLRCRLLGTASRPYPEVVRAGIAAALPPARVPLHEVCRLDTLIGQAFAELAVELRDGACGGRADLVCSHGQTLYHWVEDGRARGTLQLGQPAWIAERTGLPVVSDVRARDIAGGGEGAPLVCVLDALLLAGLEDGGVALNLGGIANLTAIRPGAAPVAYDTGPSNALVDAAVRALSGGRERYDGGGARAARGRVDGALLATLLDEPYYRRPAPKTTGKELFHLAYLRERLGERVIDDDVVATLTMLTVETVARELERVDAARVFASGGGTRNPTMMAWLRRRLPGVRVESIEALGVPEQAKEALAFALIGFFTAHGLAANVPSCTGAVGPALLGSVTPGAAPLRLPSPLPSPPRRLVLEPA
jgi:anhydro-N-acetylmuramic acid kinase